MPEVRVAPDESSAEIVLAPGERLASSSLANGMLARAGVRAGLDHAALASVMGLVGPAAVRVAACQPGRSVMGRALAAPPPADGLLQVWGDVHVQGDVGVHAAIAAVGDVRIDGDLCGGRVAAGGRVTVAGVIGREAQVEAGGGVWTTAVDASTLVAGGVVEVTGDVSRSTIEAGGLRVGGMLLGGVAILCGALSVAREPTADAPRPQIALVRPPSPRALAQVHEARRTDIAAQLARLRQMLRAAADPSTLAKVGAAIATLEARLRKP